METICKKCGTIRPQMSWTKLSIEAMGKAANSLIADLYHQCYFLPTMQTHTTMGAIFSRLKPLGEADTYFFAGPQREEATKIVSYAHFIMLNVLHSQDKHFGLDMENDLMERAKELDEAWPNKTQKGSGEKAVDDSDEPSQPLSSKEQTKTLSLHSYLLLGRNFIRA
ncbi:MAG: hypothetical protein ABJB21_11295 [bacterium]